MEAIFASVQISSMNEPNYPFQDQVGHAALRLQRIDIRLSLRKIAPDPDYLKTELGNLNCDIFKNLPYCSTSRLFGSPHRIQIISLIKSGFAYLQ